MKKVKTADFIIKQLKLLPQFKPLNRFYCYKKFISLLIPRYQRAIDFVYIRNDTLYIAVLHPGVNMELNSNKDFLKSILTMLINEDVECKDLKASKIVLLNRNRRAKRFKKEDNQQQETIPHYKERALGEFKIKTEDKELKNRFIDIKEIIKKGYM